VDPLDEVAAVCCPAACLGRDGSGQRNPAPAQLVGTDGEGRKRAVLRGVADPATGSEAFAEPDDAGKGVDDDEAVLRRARHEQAAIVGAEIERAIGVPGCLPPREGAG
jgi:hypothetical protein